MDSQQKIMASRFLKLKGPALTDVKFTLKLRFQGNYCHLVWEGETPEAFFDTMIFKLCTTEALAREFFKERKCEHYWDLAHSKATITKVD